MKRLSNFVENIEIAPLLNNEQDDVKSYNDVLIDMLKNAYYEEIIAWYSYVTVCNFINGANRKDVEEFFEDTAKDEFEDHGLWLLKRISELGGNMEIGCDPVSLSYAKHKQTPYIWTIGENPNDKVLTVLNAVEANIKNEEGAIETYTQLEEYTRDIDVVTNQKVKSILADEQEHLKELQDFKLDLIK